MPITFRTTETRSPKGRKYVITTEIATWEQKHYKTNVIPVTEENEVVSWDSLERTYDSSSDAILGHDKTVEKVENGGMDRFLTISKKHQIGE